MPPSVGQNPVSACHCAKQNAEYVCAFDLGESWKFAWRHLDCRDSVFGVQHSCMLPSWPMLVLPQPTSIKGRTYIRRSSMAWYSNATAILRSYALYLASDYVADGDSIRTRIIRSASVSFWSFL